MVASCLPEKHWDQSLTISCTRVDKRKSLSLSRPPDIQEAHFSISSASFVVTVTCFLLIIVWNPLKRNVICEISQEDLSLEVSI